MNGGSNKLQGLKKLQVLNHLWMLRRLVRSERHKWWDHRYRRFLGHCQLCFQHHQLCYRHYHLYCGHNHHPHGNCIVDGYKVSSVVKIQSNQEVSEVEAGASIAASCEYLCHARSTVSGMKPVTTPTVLGKSSCIRRMLVIISELVRGQI